MQAPPKPLPARARKLLGAAGLLAFVCVYILVATSLGALLARAPILLQTLYFAVVGISWALPLKPLIQWMNRPD